MPAASPKDGQLARACRPQQMSQVLCMKDPGAAQDEQASSGEEHAHILHLTAKHIHMLGFHTH